MKKILSILLVLFSSCSLAEENRKPEEGKDYGTKWTPTLVEYSDSATLQRLNDFYTTDPIDWDYLKTIYKGSLNQRSSENLKLTWEQARELAKTEMSFQVEDKKWQDFGLSERPRLILDKENPTFYRYYEFLVLDENIIKGSIVIPAYKKTENFFTAEVRVYNSDQVTFESFPTKWGEFAASQFPKINVEKDSNIDQAFGIIYDEVLSYNNITEKDIYYKQLSEELTNNKLLPVQNNVVSNLIKQETTSQFSNNMDTKVIDARTKEVEAPGSGDGGGPTAGSGGSGSKFMTVIDYEETDKYISREKQKEEQKLVSSIAYMQNSHFTPLQDDINNNISQNITDNTFLSVEQERQVYFLTQTKKVYEESLFIWQTNFFVQMGNNSAPQDIADAYAITFWNELDNEFNENIQARGAILVGIGIGATVNGVSYLALKFSLGEDIDIKEFGWEVFKGALLGGSLGLFPPIEFFSVPTKLFTLNFAKDLATIALISTVSGKLSKSLNLSDNPSSIFNNVMISISQWLSGNPLATITSIGNLLLAPFELLYVDVTQDKTKKNLKDSSIPHGQKVIVNYDVLDNQHSVGSGHGEGGGGNFNNNDWNCPNNVPQENCDHLGGGQYNPNKRTFTH